MSSTFEAVSANGVAVPPELFAMMVLLPMPGSWARVALPERSEKLGWLVVKTPDVDRLLNHWLAVALIALTHPNVANPAAGHCVGEIVPLISENAGWESAGTPDPLIDLIQFEVTALTA